MEISVGFVVARIFFGTSPPAMNRNMCKTVVFACWLFFPLQLIRSRGQHKLPGRRSLATKFSNIMPCNVLLIA